MKVNEEYEGTTLDAVDEAVTVNVTDADRIVFQVTGTFTATITFEASVDGETFVSIGGQAPTGGSIITTLTAAGVWAGIPTHCHGYEKIRARMSAYTSGSALVKWQTGRSVK